MRNPFTLLRRMAINAIASGGIAFGTATNIAPIGESEWVEFPYGESEYWQMEGKTWKKYTQIFLRPQADRMVAAINVLRQKKGADWRGLPIFVGHPDADPVRWPDDKRLGGIMELEAGETSMRFKVAWNDKGEENKKQGYYIYPSPAWIYPLRIAANSGKIFPDELRSVGLTNTPRIPDSPVWTNSESGLFEANNPANAGNPEDQIDMKHREMLLALLNKHHAASLSGEATNDEMDTAYNAAMAKAPMACNALELPIGETKIALNVLGEVPVTLISGLTAINSECATLRTQSAEAITARDAALAENVTLRQSGSDFRLLATNSLLDGALNAGRITAAERTSLFAEFEADFDAASQKLTSKKGTALNTERLNLHPTDGQMDLSTTHGRQIAFNSILDEYQRPVDKGGKGMKNIDEALAAMRAVPAHLAVLEAMAKG